MHQALSSSLRLPPQLAPALASLTCSTVALFYLRKTSWRSGQSSALGTIGFHLAGIRLLFFFFFCLSALASHWILSSRQGFGRGDKWHSAIYWCHFRRFCLKSLKRVRWIKQLSAGYGYLRSGGSLLRNFPFSSLDSS